MIKSKKEGVSNREEDKESIRYAVVSIIEDNALISPYFEHRDHAIEFLSDIEERNDVKTVVAEFIVKAGTVIRLMAVQNPSTNSSQYYTDLFNLVSDLFLPEKNLRRKEATQGKCRLSNSIHAKYKLSGD